MCTLILCIYMKTFILFDLTKKKKINSNIYYYVENEFHRFLSGSYEIKYNIMMTEQPAGI